MNTKNLSALLIPLFISCVFGFTSLGADAYTPKPGSPERKEICDAIRKETFGSDVVFVIDHLVIESDWAGFTGFPQQKSNGEPLDTTVTALLRRTEGRWVVETCREHGDIVTPNEFDRGRKVPLAVYPDQVLQAELHMRDEDGVRVPEREEASEKSAAEKASLHDKLKILKEIIAAFNVSAELAPDPPESADSALTFEISLQSGISTGKEGDPIESQQFLEQVCEHLEVDVDSLKERPSYSTFAILEMDALIEDPVFSEKEKHFLRRAILKQLSD